MGLRKSFYTYLSFLLIGLFYSVNSDAQYYGYNRGYNIAEGLSVSLMFGPTIFAGDLGLSLPDPSPDDKEFQYTGIAYGFIFEKDIVEAATVRLQFNRGTLQGGRKDKNGGTLLTFNTDIKYEMSLGAHVNWNNILGGYYIYRPVSFYTINTISIVSYDHHAMLGIDHPDYIVGGSDFDNTDRAHYHYSNGVPETQTTFITKFGGGANIRIDDKWGVKVELTGNVPLSNSLEGADLFDGYKTYSNGRDTEKSDFYYVAQVGIKYTFQTAGFRSQPKYNRKSYKYRYKRFKFNPGRKRLLRR